MKQGRVLDRPGMLVNAPTMLDPSMAPAGRHVFSLEVLYTPFSLVGGWTDSGEPRRWLELFAGLCEPGFLDSIVEWRAMTPDVYEREFHLPAGHATSFAGGPLAAFRNPNPELTKYETAVDRPVPDRCGDLPRRRRVGRQRPQLRRRDPRATFLTARAELHKREWA